MDAQVQDALANGRVIDITTIGRKSGKLHRIEIWFHNLDGQIYITGMPGRRDWHANLAANPAFTFHLKEQVKADLPARATLIEEPAQRREILSRILQRLSASGDIDLASLGPRGELETWVAQSPLVAVAFEA